MRTVGTLIASGQNMRVTIFRVVHVPAAGDQGSDRSHDVVSRYLKLIVVIGKGLAFFLNSTWRIARTSTKPTDR